MVISPLGSRDDVLVKIMYEAGNAFFESDLAAVDKMRDAGKYTTGDHYARAVLREETATVVSASRSALEAGLVYDPVYDAIVRKFLRPDPSSAGHFSWKKGKSVNDAIKAVLPRVLDRAMTTDAGGNRVLAREAYARDWQVWSARHQRSK